MRKRASQGGGSSREGRGLLLECVLVFVESDGVGSVPFREALYVVVRAFGDGVRKESASGRVQEGFLVD